MTFRIDRCLVMIVSYHQRERVRTGTGGYILGTTYDIRYVFKWFKKLKLGYMGFARLESSADATPAVMLSPAVAMAAEVHCQLAGAHWLAAFADGEPQLPRQPPGST